LTQERTKGKRKSQQTEEVKINMTAEEKIAILDGFDELEELDNNHFEIISKWITEEDSFVRSQCAALLINFVNQEVKEILIGLAGDKDDLVRIEAYDSLCFFAFDDVEVFLAKIITEESDSLARSHAILSWTDISVTLQKNSSDRIEEIEALKYKEKNAECALSYCYALYFFGKKDILVELLTYLSNDDYHIRCATLSLLPGIIDETNKELIKLSVEKLLSVESAFAVRNQAKRFLEEI
jgi:HEAT repeat protein